MSAGSFLKLRPPLTGSPATSGRLSSSFSSLSISSDSLTTNCALLGAFFILRVAALFVEAAAVLFFSGCFFFVFQCPMNVSHHASEFVQGLTTVLAPCPALFAPSTPSARGLPSFRGAVPLAVVAAVF